MDSRTKKSLEKLIAKVEAHKPKDMPGAQALAKEIEGIFQLLKSKVHSADQAFRLMQSRVMRDMHDEPKKEDKLYKEVAESEEQADLLHYQELQKAFKDWLHNRLETAKRKVRTKEIKKLNKQKYERSTKPRDDF